MDTNTWILLCIYIINQSWEQHSSKRTINIYLKREWTDYTEIHLPKWNYVRNQRHQRNTWRYFPINQKLIQLYQQAEPILMDKCKYGTYHTGYFHGVSNNNISLITCKYNIVITSKLQSYVLHWYHIYLLHSEIDKMEAIIFHRLHWTRIRYAVRKDVTNCDTFQRTKIPKKKYGKLPDKLAE